MGMFIFSLFFFALAPMHANFADMLHSNFLKEVTWSFSPDGVRYQFFDPPGKVRSYVIVLEGRATTAEKYGHLIPLMHQKGHGVCLFDWRGQGGSKRWVPHKGYVPSFEHYLADLDSIVTQCRRRMPKVPIVLLGSSMGGHIGFRYLTEHATENILGYVALTPMCQIDTRPFPLFIAKRVAALYVALGFEKNYAWTQTDFDPYRYRWRRSSSGSHNPYLDEQLAVLTQRAPHLATGGSTFGWLHAAFCSIDALTPEKIAKLSVPVLYISAGQDRVVRPEAIWEILAPLPNGHHVHLPQSLHEPLLEPRYAASVERMLFDFMEQLLHQAPLVRRFR